MHRVFALVLLVLFSLLCLLFMTPGYMHGSVSEMVDGLEAATALLGPLIAGAVSFAMAAERDRN